MFDFLPVYKREVKTFFQSPSTYVIMALVFFFTGLAFHDSMTGFSTLSQQSQAGMSFQQTEPPDVTEMIIRPIFSLITSLIMFTIPILSMRLIAEEKSKGTFELLVTCPIGDWSILLGKYFALLTVGIAIAALASIYPLIAWLAGRATQASPEWPVVISCGVGMVVVFAAYAAFGMMASSFTENQMTASIITLIGLILWQVMGYFQFIDTPGVRDVFRELSAFGHGDNFVKGVLNLKDFAYYILASFLFLFVASKTLDARRWRI